MVQKLSYTIIISVFLVVFNVPSFASTTLYQWGMNVNGNYYDYRNHGISDVPGIEVVNFDLSSGLGSIDWSYTATEDIETMLFIAWFDHEIDECINGFTNEYGEVTGEAAGTQMWEIDEPMYLFGDIAWNVSHGALDQTNSIHVGSDPDGNGRMGDDVSMALGWSAVLGKGDIADISVILTDDPANIDDSLFFLAHIDPDSHKTVYFQGELTITPAVPIPIPGAFTLLAIALSLCFVAKRLYEVFGG